MEAARKALVSIVQVKPGSRETTMVGIAARWQRLTDRERVQDNGTLSQRVNATLGVSSILRMRDIPGLILSTSSIRVDGVDVEYADGYELGKATINLLINLKASSLGRL